VEAHEVKNEIKSNALFFFLEDLLAAAGTTFNPLSL
jgi:hypothetical protein